MKYFTTLLLALFISSFAFSDDIKYNDSWGQEGFSIKTQNTESIKLKSPGVLEVEKCYL